MANIAIAKFFGIVPRRQTTTLPAGYADVAQDVNLAHGTLLPFREPLDVATVSATAQTVYPWGCCWRSWQRCVEVVPWLADCPRLYVTGDREYPTVEVLHEDCTHSTCRLGVPAPEAGPSGVPFASPAPHPTQQSVARESRAYLYTYVNSLGEEGPPSWPGNDFDIDDGVAATVTGFVAPPAEWCVTHINVYRRASGFVEGREQVESQVTDFFLVATLPVDTTSWIDAQPNIELGQALATRDYAPPPAGLRGIIELTNTRTLVGFVGNKIRFSANGQPWNWPEAQEMALDDNVLALREVGNQIFVATDGRPYTISGGQDCSSVGCRETVRHDYPFPMIACCSDRGAVETPLGMVFVGASGLVLIGGPKREKLLTDQWFAKDDWRRMKPETMRLGYYDGAVYCVSDTIAFVLHVDAQVYADTDTMRLATLTDRPRSITTGRNGEMFFLQGLSVRQWDAGAALRPYLWASAAMFSARPLHFVSARVWEDGMAHFELRASGRLQHARLAPTHKAFRLPSYGHHVTHTVTISGVQRVWGLNLATSLRELENRSNV